MAEPRKDQNPYQGGAREQRRRAIIDQLREDRGQTPAAPREDGPPPAGDVRASQNDRMAPDKPAAAQDNATPSDQGIAILQAQYAQREQAIRDAEAKVREASTASEKRAAEIEAKEAKNAAHLKRLEMLRGDPLQFLSEAGITEAEFTSYLKQGGKQTPEQRRLAENERELSKMREEMAAMREEASKSVASIRREREDAEFMGELGKGEYAFVQNMGGVGVVRAKQDALAGQLGKPVTLTEAAGQLEKEYEQGFQLLLKNERIRSKLGLQSTASAPEPASGRAAPSKSSSPRTLNGSLSSTTTQGGSRPAWNDWQSKKALALREMERARGR